MGDDDAACGEGNFEQGECVVIVFARHQRLSARRATEPCFFQGRARARGTLSAMSAGGVVQAGDERETVVALFARALGQNASHDASSLHFGRRADRAF